MAFRGLRTGAASCAFGVSTGAAAGTIAKSATARKVPGRVVASCSARGVGNFSAEATYEEPPVFAAFLADGTYLGEIRFPLRARVTFVGNHAWALVPDADDVQTLVKYRLF